MSAITSATEGGLKMYVGLTPGFGHLLRAALATGLGLALPALSTAQAVDADASEGLGEITITAEWREETLQRSSLCIRWGASGNRAT